MKTDFPCIECGNQDVAIVRPGFLAGAVQWFRYGRPWRPATRVCRECGHEFSLAVSSFSGRRLVPLILARTVLDRRTTTPVPQLYATTGAAGIVTGLLVGWPWWLMGLAFLIATHLFFLATVRTDGLAEALLGVISPRRRMELVARHSAASFQAAPFPVYGPLGWEGFRYLAGEGESWNKAEGTKITSLSLGYGHPHEGPNLEVEVSVDEPEFQTLKRGLAESLWMDAAPKSGEEDDLWAPVVAAKRRPDPDWSRRQILVAGGPVEFEWLAEGPYWVAVSDLDGRVLTLCARDVPIEPLELAEITDFTDYRPLHEAFQHGI